MGDLIKDIGAAAGDSGSYGLMRKTKDKAIQKYIDELTAGFGDFTRNSDNSLGKYITDFLAGTKEAQSRATQEGASIDDFYNGNMAQRLAEMRSRRVGAVNNAADIAAQQAIRNVNLSRLSGEGGPSSYDSRLLVGALAPIRTQAALDATNQERSDFNYVTGNQLSLAGRRQQVADALMARGLVPDTLKRAQYGENMGYLGNLENMSHANHIYGLRYNPSGSEMAGNITDDVLKIVASIYTGGASSALGGAMGGGGGSGGGSGIMSILGGGGGGVGQGAGWSSQGSGPGTTGYSYQGSPYRSQQQWDNLDSMFAEGGMVRGPGTELSDSIPIHVSDGEYVMPAAAVKMPGVIELLERIRKTAMRDSTSQSYTGGRRDFAAGGVVVGDTFSAVQSARNADEQARRDSLQQALSQAFAAGFKQKELQLDTQYRNRSLDMSQLEQAYRRDQDAIRNKNEDRRIKLATDEFDLRRQQPNATAVREHDLMFNQADADAMAGTFDDPGHVQKLYPALSPAEAGILAQRSQAARKEIGSNYSVATNAADTLNQHKLLNDRVYQIDDLTAKVKKDEGTSFNPANWAWLGGGNSDAETTLKSLETQKKDVSEKLSRLTPVVDQIRNDKVMRNYVTFDPKSGRFAPAISQPRWMAPPTEGTGTTNTPPSTGETRSMTAPIDTARPIINNEDGSFSTERTITIESDGKHYVIPTIVGGRQLTPDAAISSWRSGQNAPVGVFDNAADANAYAVKRSQQIGQVRGSEAGAGQAEPTVQVRTRDGNVWTIPQSKVRDALSRGAALIQQPYVRPAGVQQPIDRYLNVAY